MPGTINQARRAAPTEPGHGATLMSTERNDMTPLLSDEGTGSVDANAVNCLDHEWD
jgi:hypothetical protein